MHLPMTRLYPSRIVAPDNAKVNLFSYCPVPAKPGSENFRLPGLGCEAQWNVM